MTRDDIIRMARDAGLAEVVSGHDDGTVTLEVPHLPGVLMFAELVAAAEREACAKLCEMIADNAVLGTAGECARAIRAREEKVGSR